MYAFCIRGLEREAATFSLLDIFNIPSSWLFTSFLDTRKGLLQPNVGLHLSFAPTFSKRKVVTHLGGHHINVGRFILLVEG